MRKEGAMKPIQKTPVFCDHCPCLALAELDTSYLCDRCLMNALSNCEDPTELNKISPLSFKDVSPTVLLVRPIDTEAA